MAVNGKEDDMAAVVKRTWWSRGPTGRRVRRIAWGYTLQVNGQQERRYLVHEWTYGPYERTITLPVEVDGRQANASHGNGDGSDLLRHD